MKAGRSLLALISLSLITLGASAATTTPATTPAAAPATAPSSAAAPAAAPSATTPAASSAPAPASTLSAGQDISGSYRCEGNDFTGKSPYTSPATVTRNGDTFIFQWLNANGYPYNDGTGIYNKNTNNVMAVVFWDPSKPDSFGTLIYQVQSDGSLVGNWVYKGSNQVGTETCTKTK